ncbi:6-phosphogluconolactonase [Marinobacter sp. CHS3-4]|uniref:6-phosphogluconolactonase n=1 Tax=Marinobacter sp. CHS3-4 TaxID=3045174 RepID=UPI0024B5D895|nr:6-phosphogluconolactonase [Marinobacter sp. CHS3-4]MDI9245768.1 6-phosphogluconolactonase [Marinobacter sp. CHS3-4]
MKMHDLGLPESIQTELHSSPEQAAQALADDVSQHLAERLLKAPRASLVVSGGSTPVPFFESLREKPLDWSRIDVLLADERWVSEQDDASNTRLVKEKLLQGPASESRFFSLKQPGGSPEQALDAIHEALADCSLPVDALVLGMGTDGHTASLFPDAPELAQVLDGDTEDWVAAMNPPSQAHPRITLTPKILQKAGFTALHLKGSDKLDTLKRACEDLDDAHGMPVRLFIRPGLRIYFSD